MPVVEVSLSLIIFFAYFHSKETSLIVNPDLIMKVQSKHQLRDVVTMELCLTEFRLKLEVFLFSNETFSNNASCKRLRSRKQLTSLGSHKQREHEPPKESKKVTTTHEDAMTAEVLQVLKSMRNDLTGQIRKLSGDLTDFQQDTNARLAKIKSVMSKIDGIDSLNNKAQEPDEDVDRIKVFLSSTRSTVGAINSKTEESIKRVKESNRELKNKLENYLSFI